MSSVSSKLPTFGIPSQKLFSRPKSGFTVVQRAVIYSALINEAQCTPRCIFAQRSLPDDDPALL